MLKRTIASMTILMAFTAPVMAEDGFEVEENTQQEDSMKYMFANSGGKYVKASGGVRYIAGATAGIDYPIENGKIYFKTNVSKQKVEVTLKARRDARWVNEGGTWKRVAFAPEKKFTLEKSIADVEEAFVEKSMGDVSVTAGRSKISFSESPAFSPMSYMTPQKSISTGFEGEKLNSLIAQDNLQLAYTMGGNTEIRGYLINGARTDLYVKEAVKATPSWKFNHSNGAIIDTPGKIIEAKDKSKVLVVTHYPSWGKVKALYSDGYDMNEYVNHGTVTKDTSGSNKLTYNVSRELKLSKAKAYGFSTEFNYGKWTLGTEYLKIQSKKSLFNYSNHDSDTTNSGYVIDNGYKAYSDYLISANGGSLMVPIDYDLGSFNFGYGTSKWRIDGNLIAFKQKYKGVGVEALQKANNAGILSEKVEQTFYAGGIVGNYKLDEDGDKSISGFAGAMLNVAGAGVAYNQNVNDNLSFSLSATSGKMFGIEAISKALGGEDYKQKSGNEKFVGFALNYKL